MTQVLIDSANMAAIGAAIRAKNGSADTYLPADMAAAIQAIPTGGITPTGTITITQNGTHDVTQYASAAVNVQPNLQSKTATQNGTVTPDSGYDGLSSVLVDVRGGNIVYIQYTPEYELGAVNGVANNTYAQNKTSSATRIRPVNTVDVSQYINDDALFIWDTSNYDIAWQLYDQAGKLKTSSEWKTTFFVQGLTYPNLAIMIRKKSGGNMLPSEFADVGLKLISVNDSVN